MHTLAHPLLTMQAPSRPARICSRPTITGAPTTLLVVNTAAAAAGVRDASIAKSGLPDALMPQAIAPARNPFGAVMVSLWSGNLFTSLVNR